MVAGLVPKSRAGGLGNQPRAAASIQSVNFSIDWNQWSLRKLFWTMCPLPRICRRSRLPRRWSLAACLSPRRRPRLSSALRSRDTGVSSAIPGTMGGVESCSMAVPARTVSRTTVAADYRLIACRHFGDHHALDQAPGHDSQLLLGMRFAPPLDARDNRSVAAGLAMIRLGVITTIDHRPYGRIDASSCTR
jgi:hypothetical protein